MSIAAIIAWIQIGQQVWEAGDAAIQAVRRALRDHGIDADNALLDTVIASARERKARAEADAGGGE
jgi:hypothetical protein